MLVPPRKQVGSVGVEEAPGQFVQGPSAWSTLPVGSVGASICTEIESELEFGNIF